MHIPSNRFIALMGNIAAGKSTLADCLATLIRCIVFHEPVGEVKPLLDAFYANEPDSATQLQLAFLTARTKILDAIRNTLPTHTVIMDRTIYEDMLFTIAQVLSGRISRPWWDVYKTLFTVLVSFMPQPDVIVYLQTRPGVCLERYHSRGRDGETLGLDYLEFLDVLYSVLAERLPPDRLCVVPYDELNPISCSDDLTKVLCLIEAHCTRYPNPTAIVIDPEELLVACREKAERTK